MQLVSGISKLGPTHARSVLGGVRSGSKNQVRCSITWSWLLVYWAISGPRLLCIRCVKNFFCPFQERGCGDMCYLVRCRGKEHHSAIIHYTLGHVFVSTTNTSTNRGCDIYRTTTPSTTCGGGRGNRAYNRTLDYNNVKRKYRQIYIYGKIAIDHAANLLRRVFRAFLPSAWSPENLCQTK